MKNYNLGFISDDDIFNHVKNTVEKYRFSIDLAKFSHNLIDPIKLTFDAKIYNKSLAELIESEVLRQFDKSNTNHIGYFHQNIFNYLKNGWSVPDKGYDVVHLDKNIFVEMKNKHNTMNSSSSQKTYMRMLHTLSQNPNAQCFLVEVIAKNSQNIKWTTSLDGQSVSDERIRCVSIDKFYEIVTGDNFAFKKICEKLPLIIKDVLSTIKESTIENTVFQELNAISPNLMQSIFMVSFHKYQGFQDLLLEES